MINSIKYLGQRDKQSGVAYDVPCVMYFVIIGEIFPAKFLKS